jgi:hypothetical protein
MKRKLPFSCKIQSFLGNLGIAIHNPFRHECTHDFGCCTNIGKYWLRINQEQIYKFINKFKFIKPKSIKENKELEIQKIFYKIVNFNRIRLKLYDYNGCEYKGVFVLRNGLLVPVENMIYWEFGFPKWKFLTCRINIVYNNKVMNLFYYPTGKINMCSNSESEFDIVDFIECDEVETEFEFVEYIEFD